MKRTSICTKRATQGSHRSAVPESVVSVIHRSGLQPPGALYSHTFWRRGEVCFFLLHRVLWALQSPLTWSSGREPPQIRGHTSISQSRFSTSLFTIKPCFLILSSRFSVAGQGETVLWRKQGKFANTHFIPHMLLDTTQSTLILHTNCHFPQFKQTMQNNSGSKLNGQSEVGAFF